MLFRSDLLDLKLCLCLSALPLELTLDLKLKALTNKYGKSLVDAVISALVRDSAHSYTHIDIFTWQDQYVS